MLLTGLVEIKIPILEVRALNRSRVPFVRHNSLDLADKKVYNNITD
jgi:hypothetical protein